MIPSDGARTTALQLGVVQAKMAMGPAPFSVVPRPSGASGRAGVGMGSKPDSSSRSGVRSDFIEISHDDRRGAVRVETNTTCSISVTGSVEFAQVAAKLLDISLTGARIECGPEIPIGSELTLVLEETGRAEIPAKVVRKVDSTGRVNKFGLSVKQTWPPDLFYTLAFPKQNLTPVEWNIIAEKAPEPLKSLRGYEFVKPLGRGGSGQVYEVLAPGGIAKAVKCIPLRAENPLSIREVLGFRLIRGVRHPYLLNIDWLSIEQNMLIVVMELADSSLWEEFRYYRQQGFPGIPRARVLGVLRELAEALDVLNLKHGIVHLDVKPENLFLIAGHMKLGDYGLVRPLDNEIFDSRVNAVTAAYAAPELLDGGVHRNSDQYSLAVVFMEMLTSQRPYVGSDARNIIYQQISQGPDLAWLPETDQPIIAKALARDPADRFSSCREFIDALARAPAANPPLRPVRKETKTAPVGFSVGTPDSRLAASAASVRSNVTSRSEIGPESAQPKSFSFATPELVFSSTSAEQNNTVGMKMVWIPSGEFIMGAQDNDEDAQENERPRRHVLIVKPFLMASCPVTQQQFELITGKSFSIYCAAGRMAKLVEGKETGQFPADNISWLHAVQLCNRLSELEGFAPFYRFTQNGVELLGGVGYRLPFEMEWEYACRAGGQTKWPHGDRKADLPKYARFGKHKTPGPVGRHEPNAFGLYDMVGNIAEWCWDWFSETLLSSDTDLLLTGPQAGEKRVLRGGSFSRPPRDLRSSARFCGLPSGRSGEVGLRLVRYLEP